MEEKIMYALTFCYEGDPNSNNYPYAQTIAVSYDSNKLYEEMENCITEDCKVNEDDEWDDCMNFTVHSKVHCNDIAYAILQHKTNTNLYTKYRISPVDVL